MARPPVRLRQWLTAVRRGGAVYAGLPGSVRLIAGAAPRRAVALMLIYLVAGVAGPAGVWFSKLLVDALTAQRAGAALALAGLYVGLRVLGTAAGWLFEPVWAGFRDRFVFHLHSRLMAKAAAAPDLTLFETPAYYDRLQRARQAVDWAPRLINPAITGVSLVAVLAGLVGTLALLSPLAAAVVVLSALPRYLARVHFGHGSWQVYRGQAPHVRRLDYYFRLLTTAEAAKELRLFDLAGWFLGRYRRTYEGVIEEVEAFRRRQLLPLLGYPSLGALGVGGVLLYTVREAAGGRIGVGDLVLYAGALFLVQDALRSVLDTASGLYDAQLHVAPLTEFLALEVPAAGAPSGARPVPAPWRRGLEVQAVRFRYPGTDRDVLRGVSFTVRPGETLAVVGPNGAGKTTLVKVLCRLYDPCAGRVLLDGVDLRDYDLEAWRRQVSAVFQDFVHYHLTAGENIGVADVARAGDRAALAEAAAQAGAADVLRALPQGLDTPLGRELEPGAELSGGQWQKLALARAYFRDAPLQILDEPTAALDPRAEHEVYQRFRELARGRSTILISHRFSTVRMADRILVLDDGQVVEEGPHESLVRAAGLYADLYEKQASHYR